MKKFFDCGTHMFQGFNHFSNIYNINNEWECFCFEANPITYHMSKNTLVDLIKSGYKIEHYNYAVSNIDGEIKINCSLSPEGDSFTNQGSNILESPPTIDKWYGGAFKYTEEITYVKTINFSEFLKNKISSDDFVLVKMDIEGSEFSVLDSLIETGLFKLINEIYIEFHERFFDDMDYYVNKKNNYKKIFSENNVQLNEWI